MNAAAIASIICAISLAIIGGFVRFVWSQLEKNREETKANRLATERQFDETSAKLEEYNERIGRRLEDHNNRVAERHENLVGTANKILVQTTETNGRLKAAEVTIKEHTDEIRVLRQLSTKRKRT